MDAAQSGTQGHPAAPIRLIQSIALSVRQHVGGHQDTPPGRHVPNARRVFCERTQHDGFGCQNHGGASVLEATHDYPDPANQTPAINDE